ncbi:DUF2975 domain-containing protein [Paucibacter sp. APW11]|uniref:DUF2975 domain-containing protein n=1 Tax=Roseateles aquae TaxID=3077235 RepID=A0ABU3PD06_9BURK|nr:DUF2975 domain-containing protein [Paucibacter sp. APW11]MDT9000474.1 DUF2975 domain-containing protein [Paucibacter sp. APW11]
MPAQARPPRALQIRWLALLVQALSLTGMVLVLLLPTLLWFSDDWLPSLVNSQWRLEGSEIHLDPRSRAFGLLGCSPAMLVACWSLWRLWSLFRCYGRGDTFSVAPLRHLLGLARGILALSLLTPLANTASVLALTWLNPPGHRQLMLGLSLQDYLVLLIGLVLLAIARVMREAARLAEENAEFV